MKKILIVLTFFISFICLKVDALDFYNIEVQTIFEENIEFEEVQTIDLMFFIEDSTIEDDMGKLKESYELNRENNYSTIIKETYISDDVLLYASVKDDKLGLFDCEINYIPEIDGIAKINIMVTRNNYQNNDVKIPKSSLFKAYGVPITSSSSTTSTTVNIEEINKKEENQQKREEKKQKNNQITNILFITIGIIIVIGVIFVTIKFVNSNK